MVQYCRCLLENSQVLLSLMASKHPIIEYLKNNANHLNEEDGEILLSELARYNLKLTDKGNLATVNLNFQHLGTFENIASTDIKKRKHSHVKVTPKEEKVLKLGMYLNQNFTN